MERLYEAPPVDERGAEEDDRLAEFRDDDRLRESFLDDFAAAEATVIATTSAKTIATSGPRRPIRSELAAYKEPDMASPLMY